MESSLYILVPLSVALVFVIAWLFWWSVRSGQFDDMEGPAFRVLMDDDSPPMPPEEPSRTREEK
ncbi:MAG: cbb3-type cytochrome oxidase assembly protein CcoS [Candidatus Dactylopiibacterium sp.]|nr:cbb3-type cytochrome oxidase assembly protein CcoS [Candidatus Dactylopiibacterium sp.]